MRLLADIDEVTQYEFVGAAVRISERFLVPALEGLLLSFPFPILGEPLGPILPNRRDNPPSRSRRPVRP